MKPFSRHRGLVVRISGYSAYFNDLTPAMKDELIARSQHGRPACQITAREEFSPGGFAPEADAAANFLKALAHDGRLMILCNLANGERSVTELETLLLSRQAAVSQQLARLRMERIVKTRREGKTIYYSLSDPRIARMLGLIYDCFCRQEGSPPPSEG